MRTSILATALLSTAASARIIGLSAPETIKPNTPFTFSLLTQNYIQSVADVSVAWGYQVPTAGNPHGYPKTLGYPTGSSYLGPSKSNVLGNVSVEAVAPANYDQGSYLVFSVAVTSLYGASGGPVIQSWNVTVQIAEETSDEVVASQEQAWPENC
jgi:hypothetical protein